MRFIGFIFILRILLGIAWSQVPEGQSGFLVRVWQSQDGLPSNVVRSVVQSTDGYLWVATAEGVARFDGFDFEVIEPEGELRRFRLAYFRLFATSGGVVWATTYQGGLFRAEKGRLRRILDNIRTPLPPLVTQLIEDGEGTILYKRGPEYGRIAMDGTVTVIKAGDEILKKFSDDMARQLERGRVVERVGSAVLKDRMGGWWKAGPTGGLSVSTPGQQDMNVELPERGQGFAVNELAEDREGNIWIASPINGLVRVRHSRVNMLDTNEGQTERAVSSVLQDHAGSWWIANRRGGVTQWASGESKDIQLSKSYYRPAAALFEDKDNRLWVASRDGSVFRYNEGVFQVQFSRTQVPSKVRSITQDSKGVIWFGGSQGLASYTGQVVKSYGKAEGVNDLDLTVVQPFHGGRIIAGCASGRVLLGDSAGFSTIAAPEVLKHQWVSGILSFGEKETWVSTLGSGLYLWDGKRWSCFDTNDGLPDVRLTCVISDDRGYIWMGSLSGIIRAERKQLLAHVQDEDARVQWLRLDHTDGLASRECIGGYQPAGWRAKDGLLWFPTGSGIVRVRPDFVEQNKIPPPVYLQSVRANGVLHTGGNDVTTDPGRARLEFRFVGLSFSAPEKITYRARLAGLDDSWRELGNQRVAAFEAVPPGKYTFEVMAVNGDGVRSATPARISVMIDPHFWQTAWFYVSVGGLILFTAVGTGWVAARLKMRSRIQSLKIRNAREGERSRIARDLHDDLGASLTEISILAALAAEDADKTPLQPSLDQLSVKAKHVVGSLDEIVWAVNPREDNLRSLVEYVAAFAREFLDIARIPLRMDVTREIPDIALAAPQRHGVFLAAREALNNIVKHSGATEVNLAISIADGVLDIRISDNGRGFEPDYSTGGNGLGNLRQRMQDAGGDCRIETFRMQGTTVFLTLPLPVAVKPIS